MVAFTCSIKQSIDAIKAKLGTSVKIHVHDNAQTVKLHVHDSNEKGNVVPTCRVQ